MAAAPAAGKRKRDLSEDNVYLILHRYTPATILTALQEVARHAERRRIIDWRALVAKTATGITSAREYQMLWRYLAYRHDFVENVDRTAQPLGDESDLECEIEPFPTPSNEAVAQASGFAKILIHGSSYEKASSHSANSEVPMLNTPNKKIPHVSSDKQLGQSHRLTNGTGPVSNTKQESHTWLSPGPFDGNGPHKKKKKPKPWSKEEDADLTTAVRKCGEGNWLEILHKYNFDNTRSADQLSQRWMLICKRQGTTKPAKAKPVSTNVDKIKASHEAISIALDMHMGKPGLSTLRRPGPSQQSTQHHAPVLGSATPGLKSVAPSSSFPLPVPVPVPIAVPVHVPLQVQMPLPQVHQAPAKAAPLRVSNTSSKSRNNSKKQAAQTNPTNVPGSSIQAAAIAAGGRIATQSAATKLFKAAQSTKAVHVRSGGTGTSKTYASSKPSAMAGESRTQLGSAQHPNCTAPTSSPPNLTMRSTKQVNAVPEIAGVNPLEQSPSARLMETERTISTKPVSGSCDNMEMDDDSTCCVVMMEDLFPEDVEQLVLVDTKDEEIIDTKDAAMLEFDRFVESQKKQPEQLSTVTKNTPVFARAAPTTKKTKTLGSTFPPAVTSSGLVGTGNDGLLSKALGGQPSGPGTRVKPNRCQEIMAQKQHDTNSKGNGMARNVAPDTGTAASNVARGTGTPARNAAPSAGAPAGNSAPVARAPGRNAALATGTLSKNAVPATGPIAKNGAPGTGPPANRRYNPVVSGASEGNPPASK